MAWVMVEQDRFYQIIGWHDVTMVVVGEYPYKTIFKLRRDSREVGFVQDGVTGEESKYYVDADYDNGGNVNA